MRSGLRHANYSLLPEMTELWKMRRVWYNTLLLIRGFTGGKSINLARRKNKTKQQSKWSKLAPWAEVNFVLKWVSIKKKCQEICTHLREICLRQWLSDLPDWVSSCQSQVVVNPDCVVNLCTIFFSDNSRIISEEIGTNIFPTSSIQLQNSLISRCGRWWQVGTSDRACWQNCLYPQAGNWSSGKIDSPESPHHRYWSCLHYLRPVYTGDFCRGNSMQFLSRQNCIKFQTCSKPLRYRGDKSHQESHLVYMCDFEVVTLSATKIASSCCDKNRLCKRAFSLQWFTLLWLSLHETFDLKIFPFQFIHSSTTIF